MNVIISNKYHTMLQNLDVDTFKSLNGVFPVDEIISQFKNFYFHKMIIDLTAIKDSESISTIQKLPLVFDMNKIILLLDGPFESMPKDFLSKLVSLGIYNFTSTLEGIEYLLKNPNSYKDVAHIHMLSQQVQVENFPTAAPSVVSNAPTNATVIGIRNVTASAGATTFTYMLKKIMDANLRVIAVEMNKRESIFLSDPGFVSSNNNDIADFIKNHSDKNIILIDLNDSLVADRLCDDILYLVEPSIIKLNKLMTIDSKSLFRLKGKKIILNKSMLSNKDISEFAFEAGIDVFYNVPPINDREIDREIIENLLRKMSINV